MYIDVKSDAHRNELQEIISRIMKEKLKAIGWNSRLEKTLLSHWSGRTDGSFFREIPANYLPVLWSEERNSKYASDRKATKGFESFIAAVCSILESEYPDTAPMTDIDPRQIRPLWKKPLIETLTLLTQLAVINCSIKPIVTRKT